MTKVRCEVRGVRYVGGRRLVGFGCPLLPSREKEDRVSKAILELDRFFSFLKK